MKSAQTLLTVLLTACVAGAYAADGKFAVTTGVDYSSGKYGGTESTNTTYIPVIGKYENGPYLFKLTVPYLSISGPSGGTVVTVGAGGNVVRQSVGPITTNSGLGDIIAALSYNVLNNVTNGTVMDITGKIKFGTADVNKGLGTGANDYAMQGDLYKTYDKFTAIATLGYRVMGNPAGYNLNNVFYGSVGGAYKFSKDTSSGVILDYRQASSTYGTNTLEATAYVSQKMESGYKLQAYVMKGFTYASPDYGVGVMGSASF